MRLRSKIQQIVEPVYRNNETLKHTLKKIDQTVDIATHVTATKFPSVARPDPRRIFITLTSQCNLACKGCLYGSDEFMPKQQLPWPVVRDLLDDAAELGIRNIRLYGGEPMLHKDLPRIVRHATDLGLHSWMTTNGVLLRHKFDALYDAGLRHVSVGFYGGVSDYDGYVRTKNSYKRVIEGMEHVRERYGSDVRMTLNWLLMSPTCNLESLHQTWELADRFDTPIYVNLIHYSLPYFTGPDDAELQFSAADRPRVQKVVAEMLRLQAIKPELFSNTRVGLRSIPDWIMQGPAMRVPCTERTLLWVGADGTVQMCYVTFRLGNLFEQRLSELMYSAEHKKAASDCVSLNCPNCNCSYDRRTNQHLPTRRQYA